MYSLRKTDQALVNSLQKTDWALVYTLLRRHRQGLRLHSLQKTLDLGLYYLKKTQTGSWFKLPSEDTGRALVYTILSSEDTDKAVVYTTFSRQIRPWFTLSSNTDGSLVYTLFRRHRQGLGLYSLQKTDGALVYTNVRRHRQGLGLYSSEDRQGLGFYSLQKTQTGPWCFLSSGDTDRALVYTLLWRRKTGPPFTLYSDKVETVTPATVQSLTYWQAS